MGLIIAILFLIGAFLFCMAVASWFVEGTVAIVIVAILLSALIGISAEKQK